MTRYGMSSLLAFGFVGNIINIFIFTRKEPLRNSCSLYILAACILNLFNLGWGIIPALYNLDRTDPSTYVFIYCKVHHYIIHAPLMMSRSLTVIACMDRYALCSNSNRIRSFSDPKVAIRVIVGIILLWPIATVFLPISYVYRQGSCRMDPSFSLSWAIYSVIVPGLLTPGLMIVFGGLAISNRRKLQNRLNTNRANIKKRECTLILMLFSEVMVYVSSTCLFPAITLYQFLTEGLPQTTESLQIRAFLGYFSNTFLVYIYPAAGFYIYITVSRVYRKECKRILLHLYMRLTHHVVVVGSITTLRENTVLNQAFRS
ncbi:unnamed protein product [Rotaria socialis]|nr:unnamed protein product [Rotaria socialis]